MQNAIMAPNLIAQTERFVEEIYSARARRQIKIEDNLLAAVTIYTWLHLQALSLDRAYLVPVGENEWGLLLMFAVILILLPRQAFRMSKFYRWRRSTGQPTQQGIAQPSQNQRQNR